MDKRIVSMFSLMLLIAGGLMAQLLVISAKSSYVAAAGSQSVYRLEVCRTRGTIYDCKLRPLAGGRKQYRACIAPSSATRLHLRRVMSDEQYYAIESSLDGNTPFVLPVEDGSIDGYGVEVIPAKTRYGSVFCAPHVTGYLGPDGHGAAGAEKAYDSFLSMQDGEITASYAVSANGKGLEGIAPDIFDSTRYSDAGVVLTIDTDIQRTAEDIARKYMERGAVVVMELTGGEIRASVSLPDFSPDDIASALDAEHSPLLNRVLCPYDIGSVFKLVTAAAALERGISADRQYRCEGYTDAGGRRFKCGRTDGHGDIDMRGALALSCNTYFIELAEELGWEPILECAKSMGFGSELRLMDGCCTQAGCLPSEEVLRRRAGLANFSFGQGELLASPVHIARLIGTIANNGRAVYPTLYAGRVNMRKEYIDIPQAPESNTVISEKTAAILKDSMKAAVEKGTAVKGANPYVSAAAKTGTAETGIKENGRYIKQAWYAGFFPAEQPRYVCVVLVEDGQSGGASAGPVFAGISEALA